MPLKIYISSKSPSPENSVVVSETNPVNAKLPSLVFGDTIPAELYIVDGESGFDSVSGAVGYGVKVAIGNRGAAPTGGTFTLTYGGQTTSALAFDSTAAQIQTALRALSSINGAKVSVTGSAPAWEVEFIGALANTDVAQITSDGALLTPDSGVSISTIQTGGGGYNEKQLIYAAQNPAWLESNWSRITNGWSGEISLARRGIFELFGGKTTPITSRFEVELTDSNGRAWTYCSAEVQILPEVIDANTMGENSCSPQGDTLTLANGANVAISGLVVTVSGLVWPSAPANVLVFVHIPSSGVTTLFANVIQSSITTSGFQFVMTTAPDNSDYTFTYVPVI